MQFDQNKSIEQYGEKAGFIFSYFLFTTILFIIFGFLDKLPDNWPYIHVTGVTFLIVITGLLIKRLLQ